MKVAIVAPYFYPHPGGVEVYAYNIARQLTRSYGWEVVVITSGAHSGKTKVITQDGMKIYSLSYSFRVSNTPMRFGWRRELRRIFDLEKPDVINAHTPVPVLADMAERVRGRIPFVLTCHNDLVKDGFPLKQVALAINRSLTHRTLRKADQIITTSEHYAKQSPYLRTHAGKVSIVPPGVDIDRFNPQVSGERIQKAYNGKRILLFVGGINKSQQHKGLHDLITAFGCVHQQHPDTALVVVGKGNGQAMYEAAARDASVGDAVHFTGYVPDEELPEYQAAATALVLPSTNMSEGFGMVLLEASASGKPVIGTLVGGIPYAVEDGQTGLLVASRDPQALAEAIASLLANKKLAGKLGEQGAKRAAEQFSWQSLAGQTDRVLKRALKPSIAHIAGYYPPHLGGMEKVAQALAENLAARDYDTHVITSAAHQPPGEPKHPRPNLTVTRLKAAEFAHTPWAPGLPLALFRLPKRSILHLHLAQAMYPEWVWWTARLRKQPYVVHFHLDLQPSGPLGKLFLLYKATLLKGTIQHANKVIVFSDEQRQFIHDKYGLPMERIAVIANGVDEAFFKPARTYQAADTYQLLYVGRLSPQKRLDRLIDAMAHVTARVHLTIVGDGEDRTDLEMQAEALGLRNIRFVGAKNAEEIRKFHKKADAFVITSDREGMPLVVLEAMAAALPVVGTNVPGTRELLQGVGVLTDITPEAIARGLDQTLKPDTLSALSKQSAEAAKHHAWPHIIDTFEALYREVAS
jgi:glycosyltransferase involved in cell wall biosynthesis